MGYKEHTHVCITQTDTPNSNTHVWINWAGDGLIGATKAVSSLRFSKIAFACWTKADAARLRGRASIQSRLFGPSILPGTVAAGNSGAWRRADLRGYVVNNQSRIKYASKTYLSRSPENELTVPRQRPRSDIPTFCDECCDEICGANRSGMPVCTAANFSTKGKTHAEEAGVRSRNFSFLVGDGWC